MYLTDTTIYILIGIVFTVASVVHGVCGFGFSLFSVGALSLLLGPRTAIPLDVIAASANCLYLGWLLRRSIILKDLILLSTLTFLFVPLGTLFLRGINITLIYLSLGAIIFAVACISLIHQKHLRLFASIPFKWLAGISSGLLGGAFNIPGPPLVLYAYNCGWPIKSSMANLQFIFSIMTVVTIMSFYATGMFTKGIVLSGIAYMPLIIFFTLVGERISARLKAKHLSTIISVFLAILGVSLILKGFYAN